MSDQFSRCCSYISSPYFFKQPVLFYANWSWRLAQQCATFFIIIDICCADKKPKTAKQQIDKTSWRKSWKQYAERAANSILFTNKSVRLRRKKFSRNSAQQSAAACYYYVRGSLWWRRKLDGLTAASQRKLVELALGFRDLTSSSCKFSVAAPILTKHACLYAWRTQLDLSNWCSKFRQTASLRRRNIFS